MRLGFIDLDSLQALATQGLMEGAKTCNLESCKHYALGKETSEICTVICCMEGLLDLVHMDIWGPTKTTSLRGDKYCLFC